MTQIQPITDSAVKARAAANAEAIARQQLEHERQIALDSAKQQAQQEEAAQERLQAIGRQAFDDMEKSYQRRDELAAAVAAALKDLAEFTIALEKARIQTIDDMQRAGVDMGRLSLSVSQCRVPFVSKLNTGDRDADAWAATFVSGVVTNAIGWGIDKGRVMSIIGPLGNTLSGYPLMS